MSDNSRLTPIATDVKVTAEMLQVYLSDGRIISVPLEWFPELRDASEKQRSNWRLIGGGIGIHWENMDEDLSVAGLLGSIGIQSRSLGKHLFRREEGEDMVIHFNEEDLAWLFEKWASKAEEYAVKKAKFEEYRKRLKEAEIPFKKKEEELLKQKREKDKRAYLTADEKDEIWYPFPEVRRRIEKEIYGE